MKERVNGLHVSIAEGAGGVKSCWLLCPPEFAQFRKALGAGSFNPAGLLRPQPEAGITSQPPAAKIEPPNYCHWKMNCYDFANLEAEYQLNYD